MALAASMDGPSRTVVCIKSFIVSLDCLPVLLMLFCFTTFFFFPHISLLFGFDSLANVLDPLLSRNDIIYAIISLTNVLD